MPGRRTVASALFAAAVLIGAPGSPVASAGAGTSPAGAPVSHGSTTSGPVVQLGYQMASSAPFGWSGQQDSCLNWLWTRESGWSTSATNGQSGAYGIPQALHGTIGGQGGNEFSASASEGLSPAQLQGANNGDAADQIDWGLRYIRGTYGSPCGAWAHEQQYGWY